MRKLSKKEEGEVVTKGFLYNDFKVELVKEIKNEIIPEIDSRISAQTGVMLEEMRDYMKGMMEAMNMRFEMTDRKNEERFNQMDKKHDDTMEWLRNHEMRISKLEYKN